MMSQKFPALKESVLFLNSMKFTRKTEFRNYYRCLNLGFLLLPEFLINHLITFIMGSREDVFLIWN